MTEEFNACLTERSVQKGGLNGQFEVSYSCSGIDSRFECDITIGNLYSFYLQLDNAYEFFP